MLPFLLMAYRKGIDQGLAQGKGSLKPENLFNDTAKLAVKRKSFEHAALSVGATKKQIQALIDEAITEGQSVQQLAGKIRDQFGIDEKFRPLRIARTELTDTINDAATTTLDKEGHIEKEWSTVIDGRERETHASAHGQIVGINDAFRIGGENARYPGDEALSPGERINCRCTVLGAGLSEERQRRIGRAFLRTHGALEKRLVVSLRRQFSEQRDRVLDHFPA